MIRSISIFLALLFWMSPASACEWPDGKPVTRDEKVQFSGEAKAGEAYSHEFFPGLFFRLVPEEYGWVMKIGAAADDAGKEDFIYPVTPPYRFNPVQYLQDAYNTPVLSFRKREFSFLLNREDYTAAFKNLQEVLWAKSEKKQKEALKEINQFMKGSGHLTILDGTVETVPAPWANGGKAEKPIWIKFSVELTIPVPDEEKCGAE